MANITEEVRKLLHLLGVSVDGEVTLGHIVKLFTQDDGPGILVGLLEGSDGDEEVTGGLIGLHGEDEDAIGDATIDPTLDTSFGLGLGGVVEV